MLNESEYISMVPKGSAPNTRWTRMGAIIHQRCPRCRRGLVFRKGLSMYNLCPACGMKFEREAGYFVGAMYISYAFSAFFIGVVSFITHLLLPDLDFLWLVISAGVVMLPFVPMIIRYSKVLWMTIDRMLDPG